MRIVIASGKGGVGKTTLSVNLAIATPGSVLLDCDVEEPNAHHFLPAQLRPVEAVQMQNPTINLATCTHCGKCSKFCRYNALAILPSTALVFPHNCNGCGGCSLVCPESAITEQFRDIGTIQEGCYRGVRLVQGLLNIGEARAPPVIRRVKQRAGPDEVCIIDAPPGSSCPVVEAMEGADYAIIVTESSSYALHDMAAIVSVIRKMGIPCGAVINKHVSGRDEVERYLEREGIPVLATIPLTREIAELCSNGGLLMDHGVRWNEVFSSIYAQVQERVSL